MKSSMPACVGSSADVATDGSFSRGNEGEGGEKNKNKLPLKPSNVITKPVYS